MKRTEKTQQKPRNLKRKFLSALAMLMISTIMLGAASYAWLVISIRPEITGVTTNIGSNGSLEIALLTTTTRTNLSAIQTIFGESLANRNPDANNTWGNIVDLSYEQYGLDNIVLWPARLNAVPKDNGQGYVVNSGLLSVPTYGYDGRIVELTDDTVSALYNNAKGEFSYVLGVQDYGVRAVGTASNLSVQGSALAMAKSNITTYTNSAAGTAKTAINSHGEDLFSILMAYSTGTDSFGDTELGVLESIISELMVSREYIDMALRQGILAIAANQIADETTFTAARNLIVDNSKDITTILEDLELTDKVPAAFNTWLAELQGLTNDLYNAQTNCDNLTGGTYTWAQIRVPLDALMNTQKIYINDFLFEEMTEADIMGLLGQDVVMTLAPGSGVLADIADFTDDYSTWINAMGMEVEVKTSTVIDPAYLLALADEVKDLEAADGSVAGESSIKLTSTYGYALDMAFRCNAAICDLLLQTDAQQRVGTTESNDRTMGGGSYMEFTTGDKDLSMENVLQLMDAVRVAFIDDQGNLLRVAKLNTSNRTVTDGVVKAPLYLYNFGFDPKGAMIMGERLKVDNKIVDLQQSVAKAVTVLVWLDGDTVDNSMVSATEEQSISGRLNLQFATSADLVSAEHGNLNNINADKSALKQAVEAEAETVAAGQGLYTTVSWEQYMTAYNYAVAVNNNPGANEQQIFTAAKNLELSKGALEQVTHDALSHAIWRGRSSAGTSGDIRYVVVRNEETGELEKLTKYTQEQLDHAVGVIYSTWNSASTEVGNGVNVPLYKAHTAENLTNALYEAEFLNMKDTATNQEMDDAIAAIHQAINMLEYAVYFIPYDYNGALYYMAISDDPDTYGKWYDQNFQKIISDKKILDLDANAELADIAKIVENNYISNTIGLTTPYLEILDDVYPELTEQDIVALHWNLPELFAEPMYYWQLENLIYYVDEANYRNSVVQYYSKIDARLIQRAQAIIDSNGAASYEIAQEIINDLRDQISDSYGYSPSYATSTERAQLQMAIASAKTVEGYDDEANTALDALRAAVAEAEYVASKGTNAYYYETYRALNELNAQLEAAGKAPISEDDVNLMTYSQKRHLEAAIAYARRYDSAANMTALKAKADAAQAALDSSSTTVAQANTAITELNAALLDAGKVVVTESNYYTWVDYKTRNVGSIAITAGKSIEGWEAGTRTDTVTEVNPETGETTTREVVVDLSGLKAAILAAEALVTKYNDTDERVSQLDADDALNNLNRELKANGLREVTVYNSYKYNTHQSPSYGGSYYVGSYMNTLYVEEENGLATLEVTIMTNRGVVYTATKTVNIYTPAAGVEIADPEALPEGGNWVKLDKDGVPVLETVIIDEEAGTTEQKVVLYTEKPTLTNREIDLGYTVAWNQTIYAGKGMDLSAALTNREYVEIDYYGDIVYVPSLEDSEVLTQIPSMIQIPTNETIATYTWSSGNTEIATVSNMNAAAGTVTAVKTGTVQISLSVKTTQGNTYTAQITLNVVADPNAVPPAEPTT